MLVRKLATRKIGVAPPSVREGGLVASVVDMALLLKASSAAPWDPRRAADRSGGPQSAESPSPRSGRRPRNGPHSTKSDPAECRSEEHTSELQSLRHLVC